MSYRFIFGPSGSGKTYRAFTDCIKASTSVGNDGSRFLLIVPEQITTETEKEIVRLHPNHATDNIDILSFNRLAYRIFDELGMESPNVLDDISKAMILRRLVSDNRDELHIWSRGFDKPGFIDNLKSMISELYQYGIKPDELEIQPQFGHRLEDKIHDLKLIYSEFAKYIKDRYITFEEIPDVLASVIHKSGIIKGSTIILDGFTGFTPVQYRIIEKLMAYAKELIITITIGDEDDPYHRGSESDLFALSKDTVAYLTDIASHNSVTHGEDIRLKSNSIFEQHLLRYDSYCCRSPRIDKNETEAVAKDCPYLRIACGKNRNDEAVFIASDIQKKIKEEGLRYKDIAVVCSDIAAAGDSIKHEFELSQIPYYIDHSIGLADNVLTGFIKAALDVIASDYSYDSMAGYIKTGLVCDDEKMSNILDIYMYECGRRGYSRMRADWDYIPDNLKDIEKEVLNTCKNSILDNLEGLREVFVSGKAPATDIIRELKKLLSVYSISDRLEAMSKAFEECDDAERQREYSLAYERITGLLDSMSSLIGDEGLSCDEFSGIFTAGVEQIELGIIPSGNDRVTVGDITRSRLEGIKYLYVSGANEGSIPKLLNRGSVITDAEKEKLKTAGFELAPTVKEDLYIQRYYLYRLLTKPEKQVVISYSGMDDKGSAIQPSYIIPYLRKMYPNLKPEDISQISKIYDINAAIRRVSEKLRSIRLTGEADDELGNLYAYLIGDETTREKTELITAAAMYSYRAALLNKESTGVLYADSFTSSVSRLEQYAECPYAYFARYGLDLKDIEPFAFKAVDIGNISHAALEKIFVRADREGIDLKSAEARNRLAEECISQAILDDASGKYADTAKNAYIISRITRVVKRTLWGMINSESEGFRPYATEWKFTPADRLKAATIDLENGHTMHLMGKIDRTDVREGDDIGVRVVDYKSGNKDWNLNDVINGSDMQITIYMAAARELVERRFSDREVIPEEMYYYRIQDPVVDDEKIKNDDYEEQILKEMKPMGVCDNSQIEQLIPYVRNKAKETGISIVSGNIDVKPRYRDNKHTGCTYCSYRALCGFDSRIRGYNYKIDRKYSKEDQWQIINGQMNN